MYESTTVYHRYLDPKVLRKIGALELRARLMVEGYFNGMHRSPYRGLSVEFADHRVYTQGDDIRSIDWKVFARTDKYYVKEYEQESNLSCMLVVDCSESMNYRSSPELLTKYEYAVSSAAALAYLAIRQQDSVGLARFDEKLTGFLRPSNNPGHWKSLIRELENMHGPGKTSLRAVLHDLVERLRGRSLVVLISDLFDDPTAILTGLERLRYNRHEVIVFNIWDPAELTLPFQGPTMFAGLESSGRVMTEPRSLRARYVEEVERFRTTLQRGCREIKTDYVPFSTATPLDLAISSYLATRAASIRMRSSRVMGGSR